MTDAVKARYDEADILFFDFEEDAAAEIGSLGSENGDERPASALTAVKEGAPNDDDEFDEEELDKGDMDERSSRLVAIERNRSCASTGLAEVGFATRSDSETTSRWITARARRTCIRND
jgi:hypothetical protein